MRVLAESIANRIAAGEVIERPAAAVKELVENALDAGAGRISVTLTEGGVAAIEVIDDGHGIAASELALAIARHATSKLEGDDLVRIATLGFRGEALPAIGAVARLAITARAKGEAEAWAITVEAGRASAPQPAAFVGGAGARIEVRDLFFATPARLKFMKSARAEAQAIAEEVRRAAMARPAIAFRLEV
ncbi:MAG: DNA mismatch repair endonuclease MutL, partial [Acetobacteraceae bacterium]